MHSPVVYFAAVNFILCITAVVMCLCRLNNLNAKTQLRERVKYVLSLTAAMTSATQPWYGEEPGWGSVAMAASLVYALWAGAPRWRHGAPAYVKVQETDTPCVKS